MCRCKLCGGVANVFPSEYVWKEDKLRALYINCKSCNGVMVWAYNTEGETYADVRKVAEDRWNRLMGEEDEH